MKLYWLFIYFNMGTTEKQVSSPLSWLGKKSIKFGIPKLFTIGILHINDRLSSYISRYFVIYRSNYNKFRKVESVICTIYFQSSWKRQSAGLFKISDAVDIAIWIGF